jgi:hypothetical protein
MIRSYGQRVMTKGEGMLRAFKIVDMVRLDEPTGDGRLLKGDGGSVRDLPRTVYAGFEEGDPHGPNVIAGRLDAVEFDPENNTVTGWGWFLDDDNGRNTVRYISTGAMRGNSIHMAEIEVSIDWESDDPDDPGFWNMIFTFEKWSIASSTMLGIPAFKDSHFELEEEMTAALFDNPEPLEIKASETVITFDVILPEDEELTAATATGPAPSWEHFFRPETAEPTPIHIGDRTEDGFYPVWGHLAQWNVCHDGIESRCVIAPRPRDGFASFNASKVRTDKGFVQTGPIFFKGGHPDAPLGESEAHKAYGGVENGWADVRATEGVHGTWISGVVRPHITDDVVYVARASRISGHWAPDGRLKAIASVNVPGFDTPGRGESRVITDADGNVIELVASFIGGCQESPPEADTQTMPFVTMTGQVASTGTYTWSEPQPQIITAPNTNQFWIDRSPPAPMTLERTVELLQMLGYEVTPPVSAEAAAALALLEIEAEEDAAV